MKNGTPAQIEWACSLRQQLIDRCRRELCSAQEYAERELDGETDAEFARQVSQRVACWAARLSGAEALDDARSIIDTRNAPWNDAFDQYGWPEN